MAKSILVWALTLPAAGLVLLSQSVLERARRAAAFATIADGA